MPLLSTAAPLLLRGAQVGGIEQRIGKLQSGLSKLLEAERTVDNLTRDATAQRGPQTSPSALHRSARAVVMSCCIFVSRLLSLFSFFAHLSLFLTPPSR